MWPEFLHKYFGFNKQQGRGLFVLVLACTLIFILRVVVPYFEPEREILIQNLPLLKVEDTRINNNDSGFSKTKVLLKDFPFDPNTISSEQLLQLGFKPSSAKALVKFREKGFVFRTKEDLLKVYGVDQILYNRISPLIILPAVHSKQPDKVESQNKIEHISSVKEKPLRVELNGADSLDLLPIPGIGPTFSKRILKYRALLGGFCRVNQLLEVYGFTEEMLQKISPYVFVNPELIQKININRSEFKVLNRHPYLNYEQTKSIVKARNKEQLDSLRFKTLLGDESLYLQLRPYCAFD